MQTVNFQCGHCGKLMAVGEDFLGRQVRCPHCQQVVVAPAPAPAPAAEVAAPALTPPEPPRPDPSPPWYQEARPAPDLESIFSPPEESDDLFGGPSPPRLEIPPAPTQAAPPEPAAPQFLPPEPPAPPAPPPEPSLPPAPPLLFPTPGPVAESPPQPDPWGSPTTLEAPSEVPADLQFTTTAPDGPLSEPGAFAAPESEGPAGDALTRALPRQARLAAEAGWWFVPLVFIPLIFYAVLATATAYIFWTRLQVERPHPLEMFPDVNGDTPGARPVKTTSQILNTQELNNTPLPAKLQVALGETLQVGDLEVRPTGVERKKVRIYVEGFTKPEPCKFDSLVLHLHLRNTSPDLAFTPLDNYFDRRWRSGKGPPPLTLLVLEGDRPPRQFVGGPATWVPRRRGVQEDHTRREWVEGRQDFDEAGLLPGAAADTVVCTDGSDGQLEAALKGYHGPMLWRVHVRRGAVPVGDRRVPAAAVIGVRFTDADVWSNG